MTTLPLRLAAALVALTFAVAGEAAWAQEAATVNEAKGESVLEPAQQLERAVRWTSYANKTYIFAAAIVLLATFGTYRANSHEAKIRESIALSQRKDADARIAESNALAKSALADTERARADLEAAKVKIGEMELAQAELNAKTEATRGKVATLEDRVEPRRISEQSRIAIAALLKPFSGQSVRVGLYSGETEAAEFQTQVAQTLKLAGIEPSADLMMGLSARGFGLAIHGKALDSALAKTILHAFDSQGIRMAISGSRNEVPEGEFIIFIGAKQ